MPVGAGIFGCKATRLTDDERDFFKQVSPWGFILFARNIENPSQVRELIAEISEVIGRDAIVLIDQEGGRVQRMREPHWHEYPNAASFGKLFETKPNEAVEAISLSTRLMTEELRLCGIRGNCTPVADLFWPDSDQVIGNRAFSSDVQIVSTMCSAVVDASLAQGVFPIVKHIPGHGRATADTHKSQAILDVSLSELEETDLRPFADLAAAPFAMVAHIGIREIDNGIPVTTSRNAIQELMKSRLGVTSVLMSDDMGMGAIVAPMRDRAALTLRTGIDLAMHCSGEMSEMREFAESLSDLDASVLARCDDALASANMNPEPIDIDEHMPRLKSLLAA